MFTYIETHYSKAILAKIQKPEATLTNVYHIMTIYYFSLLLPQQGSTKRPTAKK